MFLIINLKISDDPNISIGNVKKLVPNYFDKEKYVLHYLRLGLKTEKCIVYKNLINQNG